MYNVQPDLMKPVMINFRFVILSAHCGTNNTEQAGYIKELATEKFVGKQSVNSNMSGAVLSRTSKMDGGGHRV